MTQPSRFEIMRRNRARQPSVVSKIDAIEEQMAREWHQHREEVAAERRVQFVDTADYLRDTREHARRATAGQRPPPRPNVLRRWVNYACGFGENA